MNKRRPHTFKSRLLNDCTNHLAVQLDRLNFEKKAQQKKVSPYYESLIADIVTPEFIRGYN